jgi:guanylate kinase
MEDSLAKLRKSLVVESLSPEAKDDLRELLQTLKESQAQVAASRILQALQDDQMYTRFDQVAASHYKTFRWVLKDSTRDVSREHELSEHGGGSASLNEMGMLFTDWLKSGCGFFHVAGKPGSGKSTLMISHPTKEDNRTFRKLGRRLTSNCG